MGEASQLTIYNDALLHCEERAIVSLTDEVEGRYLLDHVWTSGKGAINYTLEQGLWYFAMRSIKIDYDPDISTSFGFQYVFGRPEDYIRTAAVCSDDAFNAPLLDYADEGGYWFANIPSLYVRYVSSDEEHGGDFTKWPETFNLYVGLYLASRIAGKLTGKKELVTDLRSNMKRALDDAKNKDCMNQPSQFPPIGGWANSRMFGAYSGYSSRR